MKRKSFQYIFVSSLFILSGVAALIYQVVWFKHLSYFLGNTTYSQAAVLATFLGGLSIGSWWWGKKADSTKNPLKLFAWLEIAIAIYCFFYVQIFDFTEQVFVDIVINQGLSSESTVVFIMKLLVSSITMLIPTILMGGTLPILVRFISNSLEEVGKNLTLLYFMNSLGAVVGSILAGFYFLETFGLKSTTYIAAFIDLIVGIICLYMAIFKPMIEKITTPTEGKKELDSRFKISAKKYRIILLIAAITGFCAMLYEVAWVRLLIPILSSSTYSFTLILTVFISGITIGSLILYFGIHRIKKPFLFLGLCQMAIVISILITMPLYEKVPFKIWQLIGSDMRTTDGYAIYMRTQIFYTFLIMIIPTIFMGMSLPIAGKMAIEKIEDSGRSIGKVFSLNTLGTVFGSLIAGLILIPFIGIRSTIHIGLLINVILSVLVLWQKGILSRFKKGLTISILSISFLFYFTSSDQEAWVFSIMTSEISRKINRVKPPKDYEAFIESSRKKGKLLYYNEGVSGTIAVGQRDDQVYLYTNGKGDANSLSDKRTQVTLGQLPMILHPNADTVFVIGFGSGTTIGHVLTHKTVKYAEVAEISPEVIEASVHFNFMNEEPLKDPRLNVIQDDGVSALRLSRYKYDIIISQPSNPWSAGVGNLFTKEFFNDCKQKLSNGGYLAQWFSLYEMDDKSLKLIMRTALSEFNYISLWHIGKSDVLMMCSNTPFNFNLKNIENRYNSVKEKLENIGVSTFPVFLSQEYLSSKEKLIEYSSKGPMNTEDFPLLELWSPKAYFLNDSPTDFIDLDERNNIDNSNLLLNQFFIENDNLSLLEKSNIGIFQSIAGSLDLSKKIGKNNPYMYMAMANDEIEKKKFASAIEYLSSAIEVSDTIAELYAKRGEVKVKIRDVEGGIIDYSNAIVLSPMSAGYYFKRGTMYMIQNRLKEAEIDLNRCVSLAPMNIEAYINLATINGKLNKFQKTIEILNVAESFNNQNSKVYLNRGIAKSMVKDYKGAIEDFSKGILIDSKNSSLYFHRGRVLIEIGDNTKACRDLQKSSSLGFQAAESLIIKYCK